MKQTITVSEIT